MATLTRALPASISPRARSAAESLPLVSSLRPATSAFLVKRSRSRPDSMMALPGEELGVGELEGLGAVQLAPWPRRGRGSASARSCRPRPCSWRSWLRPRPRPRFRRPLPSARPRDRTPPRGRRPSGSSRPARAPRSSARAPTPRAPRWAWPCTALKVPRATTSRTKRPAWTSTVATSVGPTERTKRAPAKSSKARPRATPGQRPAAGGARPGPRSPGTPRGLSGLARRAPGGRSGSGGRPRPDPSMISTCRRLLRPSAHRHLGPPERSPGPDHRARGHAGRRPRGARAGGPACGRSRSRRGSAWRAASRSGRSSPGPPRPCRP